MTRDSCQVWQIQIPWLYSRRSDSIVCVLVWVLTRHVTRTVIYETQNPYTAMTAMFTKGLVNFTVS
jgi:hypothetical protein